MKNFRNTLFIDIETASGKGDFSQLSPKMQSLWLKKAKNLPNPDQLMLEDLYFQRAALYAEFGKIICIGMGFLFNDKEKGLSLKVKTIANDNENELLAEFIRFINDTYKNKELSLVAHNGKEFDFPYLCRRMLVNSLEIPKQLQLQGKKPWEVVHQDTMELWKFGDRKAYTSLELLVEILGIGEAKSNLSGDKVNETYYQLKDLKGISDYCQEDVVLVAQLFLRYNFQKTVEPQNIQLL
ncbi:3'-5' exonuclease [Sandaracinomonas limnophila]|uniref:3'-5' exonuclease n=1 Tax=Sandaracinomonas limnophila TaxID=1862386 RepID=A0A437PPN1_9BACT|nr:ribonuclease H-like domain-containing protein [Sandaracinomonas limnophila]RVU24221.1 3'-5' exonuclease [Sandaracinomonas limnophila]